MANETPKTPYMALMSYVNQLEKDIATMWTTNHMRAAMIASFVAGVLMKWVF